MSPDERVRYIRRDPAEGDADDRETAPPSDEADPEVIRVEIEQTRVEMTETIDAIQQKLNPEVLLEQAKDAAKEAAEHAAQQAAEHAKDAVREMTGQAKDAVREATIGKVEDMVQSAGDTASEARRTIADLIRQNPVPTALAGIGLGWLYMNSRSSSAPSRPAGGAGMYGGRRPVSYPGQQHVYAGGRSASSPGGGQGMMDNAVDRVQETASSLANQAQETAGQVAGQAQGAARAAGDTAGDIGSALLETIRQNPVPAALAGIGLAWLYMNRASGPAPTASSRSYRDYPYGGYRPADQGRSGGAGIADQAQAAAGQAQEMAGQAVDRVQETAGRLAGQTQDTVSGLAGGAQSQAMRAKYSLQEMFQDNPLILGGLALALGAAAAIPVPQTPQEDRLLGEARDTFVDKAQEVAQDTLQKVQHVAGEAQHTAERDAQDQGLTR